MTKQEAFYAGIGARKTPKPMLDMMEYLGEALAIAGWTLRSGFAQGADQAFYRGCKRANGNMVNYIPWPDFRGCETEPNKYFKKVPFTNEAYELAASFHPAWHLCSSTVKLLHMRNCYQVLGEDLKTPVRMVICWTEGAKSGGGTGTAIRIAKHHKIPVFDLDSILAQVELNAFLESR